MAGLGAFGIAGCQSLLGQQKIKLAVVGAWGKGFTDWLPMYQSGLVEIVALCDADADVLALIPPALKDRGVALDISRIPFYTDYRRLLDDAGILGIDAMTVSTPDHTHAAIAIAAMKQGIHVYVQKPLVRTLWELDYFRRTAKDNGVITQMGNQGSALDSMRRCTEVIQSGFLGDVTEVHVWTNRPVWPQGKIAARCAQGEADPIPKTLDWEAWLGPAKKINYRGQLPADCPTFNPWQPTKRFSENVYHRFNWRGFFDFGCGAFGDMACHTMNLAFRGLELGAVTEVECQKIEDATDIAFPMKSVVKMHYGSRTSVYQPGKTLPAVDLFWYDGNFRPDMEKLPAVLKTLDFSSPTKGGCVIVGSQGVISMVDDYGGKCLVAMNGEKKFTDLFEHDACKSVSRRIPYRSDAANKIEKGPGAAAVSADGHYVEFLNAIRGEGPVFADTHSRCFSDVDYSIPLMEGILVGVVAQRLPNQKLTWCSNRQLFADNAAANGLATPYLRDGWKF